MGTNLGHEVAVQQKKRKETNRKITFANQPIGLLLDLATELFQRGPDYYFV